MQSKNIMLITSGIYNLYQPMNNVLYSLFGECIKNVNQPLHYQKSADMGTFIKIFRNQWAHNE